MSKMQTIDVPVHVFEQLQGALAELERIVTPYRPEFLARMYRARASPLLGLPCATSAQNLRCPTPFACL